MPASNNSSERKPVNTQPARRAAFGLATLKPLTLAATAKAAAPVEPVAAAAHTTAATAASDAKAQSDAKTAPRKATAQLKPKAVAPNANAPKPKPNPNTRSDTNADADADADTDAPQAPGVGAPAAARSAAATAAAVKPQRIAVHSLKSAAPAPKWGDDEPNKTAAANHKKSDGKSAASVVVKPLAAAAGAAAKGSAGSGDAKADAKTKASLASAAADDDDVGGSTDRRVSSVKSFDDLKLHDTILRGIYAYGYESPSLIQQRAIAPVIAGHDTIAQAQSGTGKTATFVIAALQRIDLKLKHTQVLILSPTRELAGQTFRVCKAIAEYHAPSMHLCTGGTLTAVDRQALAAGTQIVVGTPGRVLALLNNRSLQPKHLQLLVLDEADEILSQGFQEQMYSVFERLPPTIQVALFSATLPPEALELSKRFMRDAVTITIKKEDVTLDGIKQYYVDIAGDSAARGWAPGPRARDRQAVSASDDAAKLETLVDLYGAISVSQCIIYANTRRRIEWLAEELNARDFTVSAIHSDLEHADRQRILNDFRLGSSRVLIATDLLARGIDVQGVSLVINFDLPHNSENYIHRIGRSGRFGRKGVSINFVCNRNDVQCVSELQKYYATAINELPANIKDLI